MLGMIKLIWGQRNLNATDYIEEQKRNMPDTGSPPNDIGIKNLFLDIAGQDIHGIRQEFWFSSIIICRWN